MNKKVFISFLLIVSMFLSITDVGFTDVNSKNNEFQLSNENISSVMNEDVDQFIVKYKKERNQEDIKKKSQKAFAVALKEKKEKKWEINEREITNEEIDLLNNNILLDFEGVFTNEVEVECQENFDIICLDENIDPEVFISVFSNENSDVIEYIQPDYLISLSAEGVGKETFVELEIGTELSDEPDILDDIEGEIGDQADVMDNSGEEISETNVNGETVNTDNNKDEQGNLENDDNNASEINKEDSREIKNDLSATVVAVIDSGVDYTHADLTNSILMKENEIVGWDFVNNIPLNCDISYLSDYAHGTHISGIIAGKSSLGYATMSNIKIMPIRTFANGNARTSDIINAIQYAINNGAKIINCSWGSSDENLLLKEVIEDNPETIFVCAAGNGRKNLDATPIFPASYDLPNIISVASVNCDNGFSYFSNYGVESVDIAGVGRDVSSTLPNNKYGSLTGTSISAASITRGLSEIMNHNPQLTSSDCKDRLLQCSDRLSSLINYVINGKKINIENALNNILNTEFQVIDAQLDFDYNLYSSDEERWQLFSTSINKKVETDGVVSVFLKENGTVWAVGNNEKLQLGVSNLSHSSIPVQIEGINNVTDISVSENHCLALKSDGTVWAWGLNTNGQLGISGGSSSSVPMQTLGLYDIEKISAGYNHSMAVDKDGNIWTWGDDS